MADETKKLRRNRAAALKRSGKSLDTMLENNCTMDTIMDKFGKMTLAYEEMVKHHDDLCMTMDDDQCEAEEQWLETYRTYYVTMEMKINEYRSRSTVNIADQSGQTARPPDTTLSNTENAGSNPGLNTGNHVSESNPGLNTGNNLAGSNPGLNYVSSTDNNANNQQCRFQMEKPKIPKFGGDVREFSTFKSDFNHIVGSRYSKRDCIALLRTSLYGKPLELITGIGNDYDAAWGYLDAIYGDPRYVADTVTHDLSSFRPLKDGDDTRFCELVHLVRKSYNALKEVGHKADMDNNHIIALIEQKLSTDDRRVWSREVEASRKSVTMDAFLAWMDQEMKARLRATAPLRSQHSGKTVGTVDVQDTHGDTYYVNHSQNIIRETLCWVCNASTHYVDQCTVFQNKSPSERIELVKLNKACFSCLKKASGNHNADTCRRRRHCDKMYKGQPCKYSHNKLLHPDDPPMQSDSTQAAHTFTMGITSIEQHNSLLPIIQCDLLGKMGAHQHANVLYDSGAQISIVKTDVAQKLNLPGKPITITVGKIGGDTEQIETKVYTAKLRSLDNNSVHSVELVGMPYITDCGEVINLDKVSHVFDIQGRKIFRGHGEVDILLGVDHVIMHGGVMKQVGNLGARLSPLGWVVFGGEINRVNIQRVNTVQALQPIDLTDFWSTESMGVTPMYDCKCKEVKQTKAEQEEAKMIEDSCVKVGGQWLISYPWKRDPVELPDNRSQAVKRLYSLENRLNKQGTDIVKTYDNQIKELTENKFARKMGSEELDSYNGPVHYISHHPIIRPESKSTPLRIVFNSSASFQGHVLNEYWHKGPDLLNNLFGIILKFRENPVALCSDISKMYHRVLIPVIDQNVHRFLWRDMDIEKEPDTYVMNVVTFGDRPAPAMAQTALRMTAEENVEYPEAKRVLVDNVYMDDICESLCTADEARKLITDVDYVLGTGGFKVKKWHSNVDLLLGSEHEPAGSKEVDVVGLSSQEKVLGVVWNSENDTFSYKVSPDICNGFSDFNVVLTKRKILSRIAQIFDPIGFAASFLVKAKIGMQKLWQLGLDWDDPVPTEVQNDWLSLFKEMEQLNDIEFERCLTPRSAVGNPSLCIFSDASEDAFGTCAYVRWRMEEGGYTVRFLAAKSRVAPLKRITIPRLELQAAVMAARLYGLIQEECRFQFSDVYFFTDSQIALAWIRSEGRSYKNFVSNRVGEIQSLTDPVQWFHVPGELNVADDVSRGISVSKLDDRWKHGPDFLRNPSEVWPNVEITDSLDEVESEKKRVLVVNSVVVRNEVVDCQKFSKWRRLIRVTAWVLLFVKKLKVKVGKLDGDNVDAGISKCELDDAEKYWIKESQKSFMDKYKDGGFKTLSPFMDGDGIIRVGGRVDKSDVMYDTRHPILISNDHWIATLITRYYHRQGHMGVAATVAKVRSKFWIIKSHDVAKRVKYGCVTCRKLEQKTESQFMSELPLERLAPHTPPFYYTSVDYFGPYSIKIGRKRLDKHYGVIFTCLNTRAVHLEMATDYGTQEFLQVLRRFYSIRGKPAILISDNGSQLVGAANELKEMIRGWDKESLKDFCAENQMEWKFVTPQAAHHNGCAESLVKGCKRAIKLAIGDHILSAFELYTVFLEVANLMNQRPIGRAPNDPDDGRYLCPNDMLLGRASSEVPQGPFATGNQRHRVEFVQDIVKSFWRRWTRDVFSTLIPRKKWQVEKRNVQVDDVVIVMDHNAVRGKWSVGRITEVFTGRDGRVRSVKVKTGKGEYSRPITKIVVIDPAVEE